MVSIIPNLPSSREVRENLWSKCTTVQCFDADCRTERAISALFSNVFRHCGIARDEGAMVWRGHKLGGNLRQTNYRCKPDASTPRTGTRIRVRLQATRTRNSWSPGACCW